MGCRGVSAAGAVGARVAGGAGPRLSCQAAAVCGFEGVPLVPALALESACVSTDALLVRAFCPGIGCRRGDGHRTANWHSTIDVDVEHYAIEQEIWRLAEINAKRVRDVTPLRCPIDILKSGQLQPAAQGKIEFSQGS